MKPYLTIVIPIYNEIENLPLLFSALDNFNSKTTFSVKFLLVNDGSTDNSYQLILEKCRYDDHYNSINFQINKGLSAALFEGFKKSKTPLIGYLDADLQTSPMDFLKLLAYEKHYDLITGYRVNRKDNWSKRMSSIVANKIRRFIIKDRFIDTNCPLKIITKEYANKLPYFHGMHRFIPALVDVYGGQVKQVAVDHYPRIRGKSKFGLHNRFLGPLFDCVKFLKIKSAYERMR